MSWWQEVRQLAAIIEDEAEGRLIDPALAVELARRLARQHPHIEASMAQIIDRLGGCVAAGAVTTPSVMVRHC